MKKWKTRVYWLFFVFRFISSVSYMLNSQLRCIFREGNEIKLKDRAKWGNLPYLPKHINYCYKNTPADLSPGKLSTKPTCRCQGSCPRSKFSQYIHTCLISAFNGLLGYCCWCEQPVCTRQFYKAWWGWTVFCHLCTLHNSCFQL